jgi:hypothetical protein
LIFLTIKNISKKWGNASSELELDCRAAGHIFCRRSEIGFRLERDLTRSFGRSQFGTVLEFIADKIGFFCKIIFGINKLLIQVRVCCKEIIALFF